MAKANKNENNILIFDTETGGLDPLNTSLLTIGFVVSNIRTGKIVDKLYLECSEADWVYRVTAGALKVNKIKDLVKHDKNADNPEAAVGKIVDFLKKNFSKLPVPPAGQNTPFDIGFVRELFRKAGANYNDFFHYSYHDTMPILRFLAALGVIPPSAVRLNGARKFFELKTKRGTAHNALDDCEATAMLFAKLADMFDGGNKTPDELDDDEDEKPATKKKASKKKSKKADDEEEEEKPSKKKKKKKKKAKEEDDEDDDDLNLDDDDDEENSDAEDDEDDDDNTPDELDDDDDDDLDDWDDEDEDDND